MPFLDADTIGNTDGWTKNGGAATAEEATDDAVRQPTDARTSGDGQNVTSSTDEQNFTLVFPNTLTYAAGQTLTAWVYGSGGAKRSVEIGWSNNDGTDAYAAVARTPIIGANAAAGWYSLDISSGYASQANMDGMRCRVWCNATAGGGGASAVQVDAIYVEQTLAATDLVIQDAAHAHAADNLGLTQVHALTVADASHGHVADALALTQTHVLAVQDALHAHAADNLTLALTTNLTVADATHAHTADNLALTQVHQLAIADASHAHAVDELGLTQVHNLTVADALHGHAAENVSLGGAAQLVISDGLHAHAADGVALTQVHVLVVQDAAHGHAADNVTLDSGTTLVVADTLHAHTAEGVVLVVIGPLVLTHEGPSSGAAANGHLLRQSGSGPGSGGAASGEPQVLTQEGPTGP